MKILCACNAGNTRSVGLASRLKDLSYESIAIGAHTSSVETLRYMIEWADKIVDLSDDGRVERWLKEEEKSKYIRFYIGEDIWRNPRHEELHKRLDPIVERILKESL